MFRVAEMLRRAPRMLAGPSTLRPRTAAVTVAQATRAKEADLRMEAGLAVAQCHALSRCGTAGAQRDVLESVVDKVMRTSAVMSASDLAIVISTLTKSRIPNLVHVLMHLHPQVDAEIPNFAPLHLGLVVAAYCKTGVTDKSEAVRSSMLRALTVRMAEFRSPTELALLATAAGRLKLTDTVLVSRLLSHFHGRLFSSPLSIRDVSVICEGLTGIPQVRTLDKLQLFPRLYATAVKTIDRATIQELARLVETFPEKKELRTVALRASADFRQLSVGLFSFGRLYERGVDVSDVMEGLKRKFIANLESIDRKTIAETLQSFLRWNLLLTESEISYVDQNFMGRSPSEHVMVLSLAGNSGHCEKFTGVGDIFCQISRADVNALETVELVKVVEIAGKMRSRESLNMVQKTLVLRHRDINEIPAYRSTVLRALSECGIQKDDDLVLLFI